MIFNQVQLKKNNQIEKIVEQNDKKFNIINENKLRINKLQEQINKTTQIEMKYKLLLKNNGKKIPGSINENKKLYVCDVCKNKNLIIINHFINIM